MDDRASLSSPMNTEPETTHSTDADDSQYMPPSFAKKVIKRLRRVLRRSGLVHVSEEERLQALVGPAGVWQESRDFQIQFLTARGLKPEHSLLDLGCGVLRGGIPLIRYLDPGRFVGLDVREG
jgi:hypothetical protein